MLIMRFVSFLSIFAFGLANMAVLSGAQVLDAARGHEDGCDRPAGPPNSPVAKSTNGPVVEARYFGPTEDYGHGVLGDAIESDGILVRFDNGERVVCDTQLAGADRVFEDVGPRLADITGNGLNDAIAVASHQKFGARLEVYGYPGPGQDFQLLAHTDYIGTRFRWLAPAGAADFNGDGKMDIAYVETPHLGKTLRIVTMDGNKLVEIASIRGVTNHRIGEEFITGGVRVCNGVPEVLLADSSWQRSIAASMKDGKIVLRDIGPFISADKLKAELAC